VASKINAMTTTSSNTKIEQLLHPPPILFSCLVTPTKQLNQAPPVMTLHHKTTVMHDIMKQIFSPEKPSNQIMMYKTSSTIETIYIEVPWSKLLVLISGSADYIIRFWIMVCGSFLVVIDGHHHELEFYKVNI
jgi:hypothetical protein